MRSARRRRSRRRGAARQPIPRGGAMGVRDGDVGVARGCSRSAVIAADQGVGQVRSVRQLHVVLVVGAARGAPPLGYQSSSQRHAVVVVRRVEVVAAAPCRRRACRSASPRRGCSRSASPPNAGHVGAQDDLLASPTSISSVPTSFAIINESAFVQGQPLSLLTNVTTGRTSSPIFSISTYLMVTQHLLAAQILGPGNSADLERLR